MIPLTTTALPGVAASAEALAEALAGVPAAPGVGQIVGAGGRNLVIGRAAQLRKWTASHLGAGKPARKGARPTTDLRPVAVAVRWAATSSAFQQRLVYERLMGEHVPLASRRDLKPPGYLRLDPDERFPRVTVHAGAADRDALFGPFRDRRAAERASKALHKLVPLRPCDYAFEPHPELPLGLGCLYAQVRSCAAPCLARIGEDAYRALATEAASLLAAPGARDASHAPWLPEWIARANAPALVVERHERGIEVYAVVAGRVVGASCADSLDTALAAVTFAEPADAPDDRPWLVSWLGSPRRTGVYVLADPADPVATAAAARAALARETAAKT